MSLKMSEMEIRLKSSNTRIGTLRGGGTEPTRNKQPGNIAVKHISKAYKYYQQ